MSEEAVKIAKTARRNNQGLGGMNFYANKMADLRADATNAFREVDEKTLGDASALAELIESVYSAKTKPKERSQAARDLKFALKTTVVRHSSAKEDGGVFPLVKLERTKRDYLIRVGRQINGAYDRGWYDACAVMMRRLLETVIIEAFEAKGTDSRAKDGNGDFLMLTKLVDKALGESWNLPRNVKKDLPKLKDAGHRSAHNRWYIAEKDDIDKIEPLFRESVEAFLHVAGLL
tara:strand:+ start:1923 stop:2621 length:699 start_codon:yes stop_codon:yes gene_type:complete